MVVRTGADVELTSQGNRFLEASRQQLALWQFLGTNTAGGQILSQYATTDPKWDDDKPPDRALLNSYVPRVKQVVDVLRTGLLAAQPYFWGSEMLRILEQAAAALPTDIALREDDIPAPFGYVYFEEPLKIPILPDTMKYTNDPHADWLRGFMWFVVKSTKHDYNEFSISFLVEDNDVRRGGVVQGMVTMPWGMGLDEIIREGVAVNGIPYPEITTAKFRLAMASILLMQQPIMKRAKGKLGRAERRQWAQRTPSEPKEVEFVYLRPSRYVRTDESESVGVDWSCRWWVRPHWRTYARGTVDEKKVYIWPYIKGPDGKPIKQPSEKVFAVIR